MEMPYFFKELDIDEVAMLHCELWGCLETEAIHYHNDYTYLMDEYDFVCRLCGEHSQDAVEYKRQRIKCTNPKCIEVRDILGLGHETHMTHSITFYQASKERRWAMSAIRDVAQAYGNKCITLTHIPEYVRLDAAKEAAALFLISKCKGEIQNGKARIR